MPLTEAELADARSSGVRIAEAAVRLYARPAVPAQTWLSALAPVLTARAQTALAGGNPAEIPATNVTGPARAESDEWDTFGTVTVPTDAGDYTVLLARTDVLAPWRVDRFTPPGAP